MRCAETDSMLMEGSGSEDTPSIAAGIDVMLPLLYRVWLFKTLSRCLTSLLNDLSQTLRLWLILGSINVDTHIR